MKYTLSAALLLICAQFSFGQPQQALRSSSDIYNYTLQKHIEYLKELKLIQNGDTLFCDDKFLVEPKVNNIIDGVLIKILSTAEIYNKSQKKELRVTRFVSLTLIDNKLNAVLIDFSVISKKKSINFINLGGSRCVFRYGCNKESWVFDEHIKSL